jgi:GAF domain-containing protein
VIGKGIGFRSTEQGTFTYQDSEEDFRGQSIINEGESINIPIKIRDEVIGELATAKPGGWQSEELAMIETIVEQIGVALESAILYQETQQRAGFEQLTREATTRMRESLDLESVIEIAASEFRKALDLSEVEIRIGPADER